MENKKTPLWVYRSMKGPNLDNDYFFFEDGTILHHYDRTISKRDFEEYVLPTDISDYQKEKILTQCKVECHYELYERIKLILHEE